MDDDNNDYDDDYSQPSSGKRGHCLAIKKFSDDLLSFDDYGISVSMLHVKSNRDPKMFGNLGLVFNYQDEFNYDFVYLRLVQKLSWDLHSNNQNQHEFSC